MIFLIGLISLISLLLMVGPFRQLVAYFQREAKRAQGATPISPVPSKVWLARLRAFGAMVRNENHAQHRPAAQIAMLLPVFCLTAGITIGILTRFR